MQMWGRGRSRARKHTRTDRRARAHTHSRTLEQVLGIPLQQPHLFWLLVRWGVYTHFKKKVQPPFLGRRFVTAVFQPWDRILRQASF